MPPMPCAHCGLNFMNPNTDPEAPKLCNSCLTREERRSPKVKAKNDTIDILIKCPKHIEKEIEEHCMDKGISFSDYFMILHMNEIEKLNSKESDEELEDEEVTDEVINMDSEPKKRGRPRKYF